MKTKPPPKPYPGFPLFASTNLYWRKDIWDPKLKRSIAYTFGHWADDPKGERALVAYMGAKEAIANGTYRSQIAVATGAYTIPDLIQNYLTARHANMRASALSMTTYGDIQAEINDFGEWVHNHIGAAPAVAALTVDHFIAFVGYLRTVRKLGPYAERRAKSYVKTMFSWGAQNGKYPMPNFSTEWKGPDTSREAMQVYRMRMGLPDHSETICTGEEIGRIVKAAPCSHRAMTLVAVNCGLGPADLGRLRWCHLNMETGELNMPRGKTGRPRRGYLWKCSRKALARVRELKHNRLAIGRLGNQAFVFYTRTGQPIFKEEEVVEDGKVVEIKSQQTFGTTFRRVCIKLKLKGITPYRLRHTFATVARRVGKPEVVDYMMGHRSDLAKDTYDHTVKNFAEWRLQQVKAVSIRVKLQLWPEQPGAKKAGKSKKPTKGGDPAPKASAG